jgi:hypothetical protein
LLFGEEKEEGEEVGRESIFRLCCNTGGYSLVARLADLRTQTLKARLKFRREYKHFTGYAT